MTTTTRYFIAVPADDQGTMIAAIGLRADDAIAAAVRDTGGEADQWIAQECTKALYDHVDTEGFGGFSWGKNADGLQDLESDGFDEDGYPEGSSGYRSAERGQFL